MPADGCDAEGSAAEPPVKRQKTSSSGAAAKPKDKKAPTLTGLRLRVVQMLVKTFAGHADADSRGAELEEAMNDQSSGAKYPHKLDDAKYKDKFKLLKINLGRNEELRNSFLDGAVTAQELCSMDPKQMLTKQQVVCTLPVEGYDCQLSALDITKYSLLLALDAVHARSRKRPQ